MPKPNYPERLWSEAGTRVPTGGSSCISCEHLSEDQKHCDDPDFIAWNGSNVIPLEPGQTANQYCSIWWHPKPGVLERSREGSEVRTKSMKIERRVCSELRVGAPDSQGDEGAMVLTGYAAKFNSQSGDLGGFRETVMPGAFARCIRENQDVKFLQNHDPNLVMGRTKNSTLKLEEDGTGLRFRVVLPNTQAAKDLYSSVKRGDIDQCSFAFQARNQSWEEGHDGNGDLYANRKLMDVDLMDCSAVTYPAYPDTQVGARNRDQVVAEMRSIGCPDEVATKIAEKRGSENQPPALESMDLPVPADPKLKEKWFNAFNDAYQEIMKKGGRGMEVKQALAHAIAKANEAVAVQTEVNPEVNNQGKQPTKLPHEVVDTDGDNDADQWERYLLRHCEVRHGEDGSWKFVITIEDRVYSSPSDVPDYVPVDKKAQWKEVWNSVYKSAKKDGMSDSDAESKAFAQANSVTSSSPKKRSAEDVSDPDSPDYDPDDPDYDPKLDSSSDEYDGERHRDLVTQEREGVKTKRVGGKDLPASAFAFVGDKDDTSTWKYRIQDKDDAARSLARWGQHKGIPKDKEAGVYRKIVAAAKEFSIEVGEEDPAKASRANARVAEDKDGKYRTVSGKKLRSFAFAWIGDPQDPKTWKLPLDDKDHAARSLVRFSQTHGIPADKKENVFRALVEACKKFSVPITEQDSMRCGFDHKVTLALLGDEEDLVLLRMRQRQVEIEAGL